MPHGSLRFDQLAEERRLRLGHAPDVIWKAITPSYGLD